MSKNLTGSDHFPTESTKKSNNVHDHILAINEVHQRFAKSWSNREDTDVMDEIIKDNESEELLLVFSLFIQYLPNCLSIIFMFFCGVHGIFMTFFCVLVPPKGHFYGQTDKNLAKQDET